MKGIYKIIDPIVKCILRSPMHSLLSDNTTLLEYVGVKSGRQYVLPVSYVKADDEIYLFTGRDKLWWRNLRGGSDVVLLIKGRRVEGKAYSEVEDLELIARRLSTFLRASPRDAKPSNVRLDEYRIPNEDDIREAAKRLVSITIITTVER